METWQGGMNFNESIDGKYVRDSLLTLGLSEHRSGAPVAMAVACKEPKSQQAKSEGELPTARRLCQSTGLCGATVTADALHCERQSLHDVLEAGGDFLFQLKENQPNALRRAGSIDAAAPPLFVCRCTEAGHGRIEKRVARVCAADPLEMGLPHVRSLIVVKKPASPNPPRSPSRLNERSPII